MMKWGYGLTREDRLMVSKKRMATSIARIIIELCSAHIAKSIIDSIKPITPPAIQREDLEYIEKIKTTRADIVRVFGVKAHMMGGLEWQIPNFAKLTGVTAR